jgi:hypothetical protein
MEIKQWLSPKWLFIPMLDLDILVKCHFMPSEVDSCVYYNITKAIMVIFWMMGSCGKYKNHILKHGWIDETNMAFEVTRCVTKELC